VRFLTDFADQAVILPMVLAIGLALLAQGWRRGAAAWVVAVAATIAAVVTLKVLFLACSATFGTTEIRTPSGHVAAATVVAGGLAGLLLRGRRTALLFAVAAALLIGITRLVLHLHSATEVMIGAGVGLAGTWVLLLLAGDPPPGLHPRRIALIAVAVALIFHGLHLPAEAHIRHTAWRFAQLLAVCQSVAMRL
jgi:membrane-associated phospholipid phosphatase